MSDELPLLPLVEPKAELVLLARWFFDLEVLYWLQLSEGPPQLRTIEAVRERSYEMQADPFTKIWHIDTPSGRSIGQIELVNIHPLQRRAEMHFCIGEQDVRGNGYAPRPYVIAATRV